MIKSLHSALLLSGVISFANAQTNYLDNYIGATVTLTTIATSAEQVYQPRDLDFKPNTNELWVADYGNGNGGNITIIYNAGMPNQISDYRKDTHSSHFMCFPSAIAFGDDGKWAGVSEIQSTGGPTSTFMGPALWSSDTAIFARVFQSNWFAGYPLGSHYDMLHQSPYAMGIAHDSAMAYWVNDGLNGDICLYDFVQHHGPGYDNHSAGKIWRYTDVLVSRVPNVPSHMVLDKVNNWLYYVDGGPKKIKRMNVTTGAITAAMITPVTAQEVLAEYSKVEGAIVEELATLSTQPCGIDYYNDRLVVSDFTTGDIYLYNTAGTFSLLETIVTGLPGMMGVKVGPDGHIWCVNKPGDAVYRLDVASPTTDVALIEITSPTVQNFKPYFYSTAFDVCNGYFSPTVKILNKGTSTITLISFEFTVDSSNAVNFSWIGSLNTGTTTVVSFPPSLISNGNHLLTIKAINVNGGPDEVELNNSIEGSFRVFDPPVTFPYVEEFSSSTFPPPGWNYVHYNPNNFMSLDNVGGFGLSTGSMKMDNFSGDMNITGQVDYLMSPIIDMTSSTSNAWLRFNVAYAQYDSSSNDALKVLVSNDCGNTWATVYDKAGPLLATATIATSAWTPGASDWRTDSVSLSGFAGQSEVMLAFTTVSNFGNNVYVDDIYVGNVTIGIIELENGSDINISPNPATSQVQISLKNIIAEDIQGNIYSAEGKLVKTFILPGGQKSIDLDLTELKHAMYAVKLTIGNNVIVKPIIKQ